MTSSGTAPETRGPAVHPFPGKIIRREWAPRVVSPMLDALTPQQRADLLAANAHSYLHVSRTEADFGPGVTQADIRTADAAALQRLLIGGAYEDSPPAMYVYRLRDETAEHTGVVGEVDVAAFEDGRVRGHESVQQTRVEALVRHFEVVPARSELVALLHTAGPEVAAIVKATCEGRPRLRFTGPDGLEQTIWRVEGQHETGVLAAELSACTHYIADGHHRVAATLREWEDGGRPEGAAVLSAMYAPDELNLMAFHRRVKGPVDGDVLVDNLTKELRVTEVAGPADAVGRFGMYVDRRWYAATSDLSRAEGVAGLDVSLLHDRVLSAQFGIDALSDPRLEVESQRTPVEDLVARCDADGGALFLLRPATVDQLIEVADRGEVMRAKTTYFSPKPQAGIFLQFRT